MGSGVVRKKSGRADKTANCRLLWKSCAEVCGKACGKTVGKIARSCGKVSFTQNLVGKVKFYTWKWKSFTGGFAHGMTDVRTGFAQFPQPLLLLLLNKL